MMAVIRRGNGGPEVAGFKRLPDVERVFPLDLTPEIEGEHLDDLA